MKGIENEKLLNQLRWRYATEKFDPDRKIPPEDWNTLEQAMILTPSSFGLEPWHFTVVTSQPMKDKLVHAAYGQKQVSQASHVVVFSVNKQVNAEYVDGFIHRLAETRGLPREKLDAYAKIIKRTIARQDSTTTEIWSSHQVYIALGFLLTAAAMLGIDAGPMEGIQPAKVDEILGLDKRGFATLCITALGYRAADDAAASYPKVRFKPEQVITRID